MQMIWPDIFNDPSAPFHTELDAHERKGAALAAQCSAWGNCQAGSKPPEGFGKAMVELSKITGVLSPDDVLKSAKAWRA